MGVHSDGDENKQSQTEIDEKSDPEIGKMVD